MIMNPFRPLGSALRDLFDDFILLLGCNLVWGLISLPIWLLAYLFLVSGAPLPAAALAILGAGPAGPATAGLAYVAARLSEGRVSKVSDYLEGLRRFARPGALLMTIWMAGFVVALLNLAFFLGVPNILGGLMMGLWIYVLIFWLSLLIYIFSLLVLQDAPDLRLVARNALLMSVGRPIYTVVTLALMGLLVGLVAIFLLPMTVLLVSLLALWSMRATRTLIDDARRRREEAADRAAALPEEKGRKGQVRPK